MGRGGIRRSGISAPGPSSDSWITKHRQLNPGVYESGASPHLTRRGHARVPLKGQTRPTPGAQRHGFPVSVSQCGSGVTARRNTTRTPGDFGPRLETGTREAVFIDTQELIRLWKGPQRVFLVVRRPRGQASWRRYRKPGSLSSGATARAGSSRIARLTAVTIRTPPSRLALSSVRTVLRKLVMWAA